MFKTRRLVSDYTYMAYLGYLLNGNIEKNLNLMESTSRDTVFKDWIGHCVMFGGYPKVEKKIGNCYEILRNKTVLLLVSNQASF